MRMEQAKLIAKSLMLSELDHFTSNDVYDAIPTGVCQPHEYGWHDLFEAVQERLASAKVSVTWEDD